MALTGTLDAGRLLTGDDLLSLADPGPCELIDGRIVPLSPTGGVSELFEEG